MVIITGPPEAQFKVSAKDHVSPAGSRSRADNSEVYSFLLLPVDVRLQPGSSFLCALPSLLRKVGRQYPFCWPSLASPAVGINMGAERGLM